MRKQIHFKRRLCRDPHADGHQTEALEGCPDLWEVGDGDFLVIGELLSPTDYELPPTASCGRDEAVVIIPRRVLIEAKQAIPDF